MTYRSKFEANVAKEFKNHGIKFVYEPEVVHFIQPEKARKYTPDFRLTFKKGRGSILVETKGRLTSEDRKKLIWVREQNPKIKLVLLFMDSRKTLTKVSKTSYGDWCRKNDFEFYDFRFGLPKEWYAA